MYSRAVDDDTVLRCLDLGARPTWPRRRVASTSSRRADRPALSDREREVLLAWFESDSKNLVATRFGLSVKTIDTYIERVRIKYAEVGRPATTKAALVARALQDGLVDLSDL